MFAYGMNTNINSMQIRCPDAICLGKAILPDYRFRFARHADVIPSKGSEVEGALWEITDDCLANLDICEGYPYYYDRVLEMVEFRDNEVAAYVYVMQPGMQDSPPYDSYLDMITIGYQENGIDLTQVYEALTDTVQI